MRKKTAIPSAFENVLGDLGYSNTMSSAETTNMDTLESTVDVETNIVNDEPDPKDTEVNDVKNTTTVNNDDNSEIPDEVLN